MKIAHIDSELMLSERRTTNLGSLVNTKQNDYLGSQSTLNLKGILFDGTNPVLNFIDFL